MARIASSGAMPWMAPPAAGRAWSPTARWPHQASKPWPAAPCRHRRRLWSGIARTRCSSTPTIAPIRQEQVVEALVQRPVAGGLRVLLGSDAERAPGKTAAEQHRLEDEEHHVDHRGQQREDDRNGGKLIEHAIPASAREKNGGPGIRDLHLGGAEGTRTPDPHTASVVRYQLRHSPKLPGRLSSTARGDLIAAPLQTGPTGASTVRPDRAARSASRRELVDRCAVD